MYVSTLVVYAIGNLFFDYYTLMLVYLIKGFPYKVILFQ